MSYLWPLERLLRHLNQTVGFKPPSTLVIGAFFAVVLLVMGITILLFPKYSSFIYKSLRRNFLRTTLASMAIMVLAFVVTLVWSILIPLDAAMTEQTKDFKAIVSERWQVPSQMPYAYASTLEEGGYTHPGDIRVKPEDSMTWSFYGGTTDPEHLSFENILFFFAMDPRKLPTMMDELENIDPKMIERMEKQSDGCIIGRDRLKKLNKKVGERLKVTSLNYRGIDLEFEVIGMFPDNPRYNQTAVMNRDYLQRALDQYQQKKRQEASAGREESEPGLAARAGLGDVQQAGQPSHGFALVHFAGGQVRDRLCRHFFLLGAIPGHPGLGEMGAGAGPLDHHVPNHGHGDQHQRARAANRDGGAESAGIFAGPNSRHRPWRSAGCRGAQRPYQRRLIIWARSWRDGGDPVPDRLFRRLGHSARCPMVGNSVRRLYVADWQHRPRLGRSQCEGVGGIRQGGVIEKRRVGRVFEAHQTRLGLTWQGAPGRKVGLEDSAHPTD